MAALLAQSFTTCHTTRSVTPSPQVLPARQTHRNTRPLVRTCSMGSAPLTTSAEEAVSKWKFHSILRTLATSQWRFVKPSSATRQYAELRITFDFDPQATTEGQVRAGLFVEPSPCAQRGESAIDENGDYVWLTSDDLMRRVIAKQASHSRYLGHGHLRVR